MPRVFKRASDFQKSVNMIKKKKEKDLEPGPAELFWSFKPGMSWGKNDFLLGKP